MTDVNSQKMADITEELFAKWNAPEGVELIREGAKIVRHLKEHGPLPIETADAMLPDEERAKGVGMVQFFRDRHYDLEMDGRGNIVGAGLSLIDNSRHTAELDGTVFRQWCVADAVMFPIIFGGDSPVTTSCPATGEPISFTVTPTGIEDASHPDPWFTLAAGTGGSARVRFCDRVNAYRDRPSAMAAAAADPEIAAGPVADLWTTAKNLAALF
ncbi:organomercurial lyase [Catenulispora pinisilvae]|uniref:organomercurial lyase n=1 Tax=Catenulispora pinisilvae TaxID=2705253 RepID=UPI00189287EA|nr:organomercurial lyase [Catenulispora pinisilvae]